MDNIQNLTQNTPRVAYIEYVNFSATEPLKSLEEFSQKKSLNVTELIINTLQSSIKDIREANKRVKTKYPKLFTNT